MFTYTPTIPSLGALTDYMQQTSPYLWNNGNPNLKVAENFTYSLAAQYVHRKFSAVLISDISDVKNSTFSDITYLGDGKFLSQTVNAKRHFAWKNSLQLSLTNIHGFGANVQLALSRYESEIGQWDYHLTSFEATMNLWWNKGPWTVSYYRKFPGKYLYGYMVSKGENADMLQVEYRPNKHWNLGIAWWYMFDNKGARYPSWSNSPVNPSVIERNIKDCCNMVTLSATYTTDFGALFKRNTRRSLNNSDSNNAVLKN